MSAILKKVLLIIGVLSVPVIYTKADLISQITYNDGPLLKLNMSETRNIKANVQFSRDKIPAKASQFTIIFKAITISPQFDILALNESSRRITITSKQLNGNYSHDLNITLHPLYIGHAKLVPLSVEYYDGSLNKTVNATIPLKHLLKVTIVPPDGIWNRIFIISVSIFIIISYINIGAQLDLENIKKIIEKPKTIILGFIISVLVMPLTAFYICHLLLGNQMLYRIGAFIFACGPAATASTLWTVMLDSDKELSVGLQVVSTIGALVTMPILLYFMDSALDVSHNAVTVPYSRLVQTLTVLLVALLIGARFVGRYESAQKLSRRLFRPLTFFVLLFIIVFSSIVYWYIYQMFDWRITLTSFVITMVTYLVSGFLGYCIGCNLDHAVAISISSTYKNSGIAFAVLVVAFEAPDTYIAYVPCLTQVVTTSLTLYLFYCLTRLVNCLRRRGQPEPIQATPEAQEDGDTEKATRSGSFGDKSVKSDDFDIPINLTDIPPGSPASQKTVEQPKVDDPLIAKEETTNNTKAATVPSASNVNT